MVWRYTTVNCVRVWRNYVRVGPAEAVSKLAGPCARAAVVGGVATLGGLAPVAAPPWRPVFVPLPRPAAMIGELQTTPGPISGANEWTIGGSAGSEFLVSAQPREATRIPEPSSLMMILFPLVVLIWIVFGEHK